MQGPLNRIQQRSLASRFAHPWNRQYCYWKMRTDPLYPAVTEVLLREDDGTLPLLDIGCGMGLFAAYLREAGFRGSINGIDYDARKIRAAKERLTSDDQEALQFFQGDVREALPDFRGHVTILDVLQYLDGSEQARLLETAVHSLAPGGRLIIRSGLAEPSWRFRLTRGADWFAHGCLWMKGRPVHYPDRRHLEGALTGAGLEGRFSPLWGRTPFNNYLGVFARTESA